jgi:hypothetical protein
MPADLQPLIDEITAIEGVDDSAIAFISGIAARIQAAVDAALANGATAEQLQPVVDLGVEAKAKSDALAAAIAANGG